jgi:hypothetical protein
VSVDTVAIRRGTQKSTIGKDTRVALLRDGRELPVSRSGTLDCRSGCNNNMEDLKKELASLRLDDEPPRSRREGDDHPRSCLCSWSPRTRSSGGATGVFAATEVETTTPRVERSGGAPSGTPLLTVSGYAAARRKA